jgi:coenzyme F420-reducing hydrogenase alpha subunit
MLLLKMVQYFLPVIQQQLLLTISKNNNKPVLEAVQTLETSFSTSVTERISWVDVCYNIKASCVLHVINNYAVIIFASYIA